MKVQIKQLTNGYFSYRCVKYREGDILEVEPEHFNSDIMVDLTEPIVSIIIPEPVVKVVKPTRKRKVVAPVESSAETTD